MVKRSGLASIDIDLSSQPGQYAPPIRQNSGLKSQQKPENDVRFPTRDSRMSGSLDGKKEFASDPKHAHVYQLAEQFIRDGRIGRSLRVHLQVQALCK